MHGEWRVTIRITFTHVQDCQRTNSKSKREKGFSSLLTVSEQQQKCQAICHDVH